ncbi:uncharacterized protein LOC115675062 [Syzygium oleosum]|uniref:uncharacterized protein LOC115675062 n=1 Tax=Syzygium oleosum TaxID=219896 RepID=UPI0024B89922|nr:uncharacterized protein LOC115675062 [Syzygium oleosum]
MPPLEDVAWKFVIRKGKKWRCPYCEIESSGGVTRVKSHLLKLPKGGISICKKVPEPISSLMDWLDNEVRNKDDIAWKLVNRLADNKWRCHYCSEEFSGDLAGVKGHLLKVPNEGISACTEVPDHVRELMLSLLDEVAEEESREVAEEQGREANGQSSTEPQSRDTLIQAEVAEEESREANSQFSAEPQSWEAAPCLSPQAFKHMKHLLATPEGTTDMANLTSDKQQGQRQYYQSVTMPSLVQDGHGMFM